VRKRQPTDEALSIDSHCEAVQCIAMKRCLITNSRRLSVLCVVLMLAKGSLGFAAQPSPAAVSAFNNYVGEVESRMARQHHSAEAFLAPVVSAPESDMHLRGGELIVDELTPTGGAALPGALLHHWRGTAFSPGATAVDFDRLMKNFGAYPQRFSPEVMQAKLITQQGNHLDASMRVRQRHVITVVMDTSYDITFGRLDAQHGYSVSRSTRISEIDAPGTAQERVLNANEEHGFLWRQNTYWSYEERDGGLYMQVESVSLTRSIPRGLGWVVQPFIESIPRESLEFTLRSTCNALRK
jgi:hypothetical protein